MDCMTLMNTRRSSNKLRFEFVYSDPIVMCTVHTFQKRTKKNDRVPHGRCRFIMITFPEAQSFREG
jgi:hypothetical protein